MHDVTFEYEENGERHTGCHLAHDCYLENGDLWLRIDAGIIVYSDVVRVHIAPPTE